MPHTITLEITDRERAAMDEIRGSLGFRSDEQTLMAGLYKLAQWLEPDVDGTLFRLDRKNALKAERAPVVPDPAQPVLPGTEPA